MLTQYKPNIPLRSVGSSRLEIPRVHTKQGESAFSYYAARSWNQLPEEIRCAKTLATFKSSLKTHLFAVHLLNEHFAMSELIALYFIYTFSILNCFKFILNRYLYHFKFKQKAKASAVMVKRMGAKKDKCVG